MSAETSNNSGKSLVSFVYSGNASITTDKLNGKNYLNWSAAVNMWFLGQKLSEHLTKKPSDIDKESRDVWEQADYQLVSLLWQSIEPTLLVHYRSYTTCYDIWEKAKNVYSNDVQRLYDVIHNLSTLQMTEDNIMSYANRAQSAVNEFKTLMTDKDPKKMIEKLDNVCMIFVLHGLQKNYESVRSQVLAAPDIPSTESLITRLVRLHSSEGPEMNESKVGIESSAFVSNFAGRGGRGRGYGGGRGGRGGGRPQCTYCKRFGHTQDKCYSLIGFPAKPINITQSSDDRKEFASKNVLSDEQYKEFMQYKASQASPSITIAHTGNPTVCLSQSSPTGPWILDSGASDHVAGNPSLFSKISQPTTAHHITLADGSKTKASGIGQATLLPSLSLDSVLLVPDCPFNLVSVSRLTRSQNCSITFTSDSFFIQDRNTKQMIGTGYESRGLYYLQSPSSIACTISESPSLLHRRLGHPNLNKLRKMVPQLSHLQSLECESCQLGKHVRSSFSSSTQSQAYAPFDVIHSDIWGPSRVTSILGPKYFVTFIDEFSRCTWIYLLKERSELFGVFQNFFKEIQNQFNSSIRILRSDNAKEYFSASFNSFMAHNGIIHQSSCPHTPQQNGIAERKHRHIIETARTLLIHANVPSKFWGDAVLTAVYLINRMPSSALQNKVPHSILFPGESMFRVTPRVFGSTCFVHDLTPGLDKLTARAVKCVFLGYSRVQKGYRCYCPSKHRFYISADVTFFEDTPFFTLPVESEDISQVLPIPSLLPVIPSTPILDRSTSTSESSNPRPLQTYQRRQHLAPVNPPSTEHSEDPDDSSTVPVSSSTPDPPETSDDLPIALRKGIRLSRNPHPIYNFLSYHRLSPSHYTFVSALSSITIPKTLQEALSHSGWRQAMIDEMTALESNQTWTLVPSPPGKSIVGCRWVYTVKIGPDGSIDRLKARLVAKGYTQVFGLDYGDTFSPVAKIASVRLLLSMAAMRHWPLYQLDIKNAFLHGDLEEEVYMEQPPGFVAQGECSRYVCRLHKALYGLKQSPRAWFGRFSSIVQQYGMIRSEADHSVFYKCSSNKFIYLVVYVDDIVITGNDHDGIAGLKQHLTHHFQTKDLGRLRYFLGIEVAQSKEGISISQRKYALDILEETGMLDCKPIDTPMDPNVKLLPNQGESFSDQGRYRRLVGKLNYLTITRPDISFAVSVVSQFLNSPCDSHWEAVVRILRYIKGSPGRGLVYTDRGHSDIIAYTDADWAGSPADRRSTSGFCILFGGNLVSWKSKKQNVVARSSAEAEYRAMALTTCELVWLKHLLQELCFCGVGTMSLICDNQAALHIASNPVFHERTKHIEIDCHFIREKIISGEIATSFVGSNEQLADIFTKSLRGPRITYICDKLDAYNLYAPA